MAEAGASGSSFDDMTEFRKLLDEMIERPCDREAIERRIEDRFKRTSAVMVLDMTGFSRTTQVRGVVPYLLMVHQMRLLATPVIEAHAGRVLKAEADNLLCLFASVPAAAVASREVIRALDTANLVLPQDLQLYASIGVGYGPILQIGEDEVAGNEVNLAAKLGEDIADRREILLTPGARAALAEPGVSFEARRVAISGLELEYFALEIERSASPAAT